MKYDYLTNVPLDRAAADYIEFLKEAGMREDTEVIPVREALSRVTANAIYASLSSPHYNASAMDGVALRAELTFNATETTPVSLSDGDFIRVDTGDPLPEGCDAVVMIEDVVECGGGILLYSPIAPYTNVRQIGEDICSGDMLLPSYEVISPAAMGALLAGGVMELEVIKKPLVGIIPTGDEVVAPTAHPKPGDIMEFNSAIFSGMLSLWGAVARVYPIIPDDKKRIQDALTLAANECDAVLISAGTSAGRDDNTADCIRELGSILYHGIAIKPGKPAVLGRIGAKPVAGVPGYPVSSVKVMEKLFRPVVEALLHLPRDPGEYIDATLSRRVNSQLKYRKFVRANLIHTKDGYTAVPLNRGAGVVTSLVKADCILDIPQDSEGIEAGGVCRARLLRKLPEIDRTVNVIGSHDPLIDELADLLRRYHGIRLASSHVGSMGGIMAIKRGEALAAGSHLLDEETGIYNLAYMERYLKGTGAVLMECVERIQGLMVASGNPKKITGLSDISRPDVSYVNRQKGSGTRVLLDYKLKELNIPPASVYGYSREEFTHTAVAAQIAGGTADAGLGIYSAAKLYGLDFLPVCNEQYDLIIAPGALDDPRIQALAAVLKSPEFAARLTRMGGYTLTSPGTIRS